MRSTIFTSGLVLALAGAAQADDSLSTGCFARDYTDEHLASHPDQVADDLTLYIQRDETLGNVMAELTVRMADQGHAAEDGLGGQTLGQSLVCWEEMGETRTVWRCGVECDGGILEVTRDDGKELDFVTTGLLVGNTDGCGGRSDLAEEPGEPVTYRLFRADPVSCGK